MGDISKSPKKGASSTMAAAKDGVPRATTSNAGGGTLPRDGGGRGGGGGGDSKGRSPKRTPRHLRDIEGEPRYTGREMRLTACVAILTISLFGLGAFVAVAGPLHALLNPACLDEKLGYFGLCDSEECIDISYRSVHSANFSLDPCEDFYQFACAKWQTQHAIAEGELILATNIHQLKDSVEGFLRTLLEQETPSHKADPGVIALKNFYKSCINFTDPDENELILDLLDSLGGYKTPDLWSENAFDLTEVILKFLQVNAAPLFDLTLDIDAKNRERYALIVELPRPTSLVPNLLRPAHRDDDLMHSEYAYYNLMEENEAISSLEMGPGLLNRTSQSNSTRTPPPPSSPSSSTGAGDPGRSNGAGDSSTSTGPSTVDRQTWYKMIKDSLDAKRREELKSLVRKVGQLIRMSEAEILSESGDIAVIASNIEKIKPSQRSRKFWKQQNKEYNAYTLDQLQHQFGTVQWSFLFGELMGFDDVASREAVDDYFYTRPGRSSSSGGGGSGNQKGNSSSNNNSTINWHNSTIYLTYPDYLRRVLQMTQYTNKRMLYNTMLILYVKDMLHDLIPRSHSSGSTNTGSGGTLKEEPKQHQQPHSSQPQQHHPRARPQQHRSHHHHQQQRKQHRQQRQQQQPPLHQQQPRWKFCVQSTKSVFSMELSSLYMKSFKPSSLKRIAQEVEAIFVNVKETLITFLNRSMEESPQDDAKPNPLPPPLITTPLHNSNQNHQNQNHTQNHNHQAPPQQYKKRGGQHEQNGSNSHSSNNSGSWETDDDLYDLPHREPTFKDEAIRKIATLKGNFLGPSFYLQEDFLDDAIKNIRMDPNDFLFNLKVVYRTFREQLYHLYWKPVDEERATWAFVTFPTTVNAFYIPQFNSIVIPLAFLNPPNFVERAPVYINYATIAHTLAHEALHALDRTGSGFDADGRLHERWEAERKGFLQEKANCVAKQYSEHFRKNLLFYQTHVPIQVDGNLTQNENLADIAGLQVAFSAYRKYRLAATTEDLKTEMRIPGLVLTLEQAYFLTFAQAYCANISPMWYIFFLEMEEHTPHPERINGMLMNSPEFAEAFSCRAGAQMNPPLKCSVW